METTFQEAAKNRAAEIVALIVRKQQKYGKNNINEFGEVGIVVRSNDKFARIKNMVMNNIDDAEESKKDTWMDIAGYAIIALMHSDGSFNLPMERDK